jgi:hypothetical protein
MFREFAWAGVPSEPIVAFTILPPSSLPCSNYSPLFMTTKDFSPDLYTNECRVSSAYPSENLETMVDLSWNLNEWDLLEANQVEYEGMGGNKEMHQSVNRTPFTEQFSYWDYHCQKDSATTLEEFNKVIKTIDNYKVDIAELTVTYGAINLVASCLFAAAVYMKYKRRWSKLSDL